MAVLILILRLIHILGGVFWAGVSMFLVAFLGPSAAATAPESGRLMQHLMVRTRYNTAMGIAASGTFLSGIALFYFSSGRFNGAWFGTPTGIALTIGAVLGVLTYLHGVTTIVPTNGKIVALAKEIMGAGGPPSEEQKAEMGRLQAAVGRYGRSAIVIMVLTVVFMAINEAV